MEKLRWSIWQPRFFTSIWTVWGRRPRGKGPAGAAVGRLGGRSAIGSGGGGELRRADAEEVTLTVLREDEDEDEGGRASCVSTVLQRRPWLLTPRPRPIDSSPRFGMVAGRVAIDGGGGRLTPPQW